MKEPFHALRVMKQWGVRGAFVLLPISLVLAACASADVPPAPTATFGANEHIDLSPQQLREAYAVTPLIQQGDTGKGVTIALIEYYGDPTLQQDVDMFDQKYGLPALHVRVLAPLGTVPSGSVTPDMAGWRGETAQDAEIIHAIAPDAQIVVMTSPVDETEGVQGLPQFLQLEQDVVTEHLATIVAQTFDASEYTLADAAGQQEIQQWDRFYQQATTQDGITFIAGTGNLGATDMELDNHTVVPARTIGFPADDPWVTAVGGTRLWPNSGGTWNEIAMGGQSEPYWGSAGGFSSFFSEPSYQQGLPTNVQSEANGKRGVPDVSATAEKELGLNCYDSADGWFIASGVGASATLWAGVAALAEQEAGHPLGFLNPALYKLGESPTSSQDYRDITVGGNTTYDPQGQIYVQGYSAGPGWDPVNGWGAPLAAHLVPDLLNALK